MSRIVLIDDEPVLRLTFRHILEGAGHEVRDAANGKIGVSLCRQACPDLVITDVIMPEQEGGATLEILEREFPGVPVIVMSGTEAPHLSAIPSGQVCYVLKPLDRPRLLQLVEAMLAHHEGDCTV